jgi:hypothetical protein
MVKQARFGQPAVYNASAITLTDGDSAALQEDINGNLLTSAGTAAAGEDVINDVQKVEQRYTYTTITTATTTLVKTGVGLVHTISILGGTLGAITVYDNTAASGTTILPTFTPTAALPCPPIILDESFTVGLTVVTAAATIINVSSR